MLKIQKNLFKKWQMNLDINSKFKVQFLNSPIEIQKKAIELLQLIQKSENINHLNSSALVGFPYIHKIVIEGYSFCFYI